jgi:hypothetical protein
MASKRSDWTYVCDVASETEQNTKYAIDRHADGYLRCACMAFRFQRVPLPQKSCKHLRALLGLSAALPHVRPAEVQAPVRVTQEGETFVVTRRAISLTPLSARSLRP